MRVQYYTTVDPGIPYDPKLFADQIAIYLADPYGWGQYHTFVPTVRTGKHIRLCRPHTLKAEGCRDDQLSCAILGGTQIWLNYDRWIHGSKPSRLPLERYRQYMVTHEMGHSLGYEHATCPGKGPAPVMMQQTIGIGACTPNTALTEIDLRMNQ